jgi:sulfate adenylyltransferase
MVSTSRIPDAPPEERIATGAEAGALAAAAERWPSIPLDAEALQDLEILATGAAAPLRGFLGRLDHRSVLDRWRLASGAPWPWPVVLPVPPGRLGDLRPGTRAALRDEAGALRGAVAVSDAWVRSPREEALALHGTESPVHPGAARVLARPPGTIGGEVTLLSPAKDRPALASSPRSVRDAIARHGWRRAAVVQPRGLPTRAQAQVLRVALGLADGIVVQPVPADGDPAGPLGRQTLEAWRAAVGRLPADRVVIGPSPLADRNGGGREVLLQALVRRNQGASDFLLVREGDLLRPGDGLPAGLSPAEIGISIVPFAAEFSLPDGDGIAAVA